MGKVFLMLLLSINVCTKHLHIQFIWATVSWLFMTISAKFKLSHSFHITIFKTIHPLTEKCMETVWAKHLTRLPCSMVCEYAYQDLAIYNEVCKMLHVLGRMWAQQKNYFCIEGLIRERQDSGYGTTVSESDWIISSNISYLLNVKNQQAPEISRWETC